MEDELEAFFHVLLYHAVRFLPHNIDPDSVPQFLEDYFDGCSTKNGEYRCGMAKSMAMENGTIKLSTYNMMPASLTFVQRSDRSKVHVLDGLISRLLCSFKEAYALHPQTLEQAPPPKGASANEFLAALGAMPNVRKPTVAAPVTPQKQKPVKSRAKGKSRASPKPSRRRGRKEAAVASATSSSPAEGAISLKEHGPLVDLFHKYIEQKGWPSDDKGEDLRVKDVKVAATSHQGAAPIAGRSESTSRKRALENAQTAPGANKRSKF